MKMTLTIVTFFFCLFSVAQNGNDQDSTEVKKEVYFNLNLHDHTNDQLLHVDINPTISYMVNVNLEGHNTLWLGRYTIDRMTFKVSKVPKNNLESYTKPKINLYYRDIRFKCFAEVGKKCPDKSRSLQNLNAGQPRTNNKAYKVAHFVLDLTTKPTEAINTTKKDMAFSVFKNAIFDLEVKINDKDASQYIRSISGPGTLNFGGHICKTRINY